MKLAEHLDFFKKFPLLYHPETKGITKARKPPAGGFIETCDISLVDKFVHTHAILDPGYRHQNNFVKSFWCILDFDSGTRLDEAIDNIFCDTVHIIGTSQSHTQEWHKFRVLIPWGEVITDPDVFKHNIKKQVNYYNADPKPTALSQCFYPMREIISVNTDGGYLMDVEKKSIKKFKPRRRYSFSYFTRYVEDTLEKPLIPIGERDETTFRLAKDLNFQGQMDKEEVIDFINERINFENPSHNPWGVNEITRKVNTVLG